MTTPRLRLLILATTLIFCGGAHPLHAQEDFKGGARHASNPPVYHRTSAASRGTRTTTINEKVERAIEQGNRARDKANTVGTSDDLDVAQEFYKKALALNPKEARALVGLGNVEMDYSYPPDKPDGHSTAWDEGMKRAEGYYQKALEINPKEFDAYMGLANIYYIKSSDPSMFAKSEQTYKQAMSLRPRAIEPYSDLAVLYEVNNRYAEAEATYREAIKLTTDKESLGDLYFSLGYALETQKKYEEAADVYRKGIKLDPKNSKAHFSLGEIYLYHQKKYTEAIEELLLSIKLDAADPEISDAEMQSSKAVLYEAYYKLGLSYVEAKNKAAAMEQYQNLRKAGQTDYAEKLLAEINKL